MIRVTIKGFYYSVKVGQKKRQGVCDCKFNRKKMSDKCGIELDLGTVKLHDAVKTEATKYF